MSTHTPAPWRIGPVDDTRVVDALGNEVAAIDGDYNDPDTWPLMEANARLISTAPELLIELKKQVDWLRHIRPQVTGKIPGTIVNGIDQSIKYMSAIIEKAEGHN